MWQALLAIAEAHSLLTVTTHYAQYGDMLLRQASLPEGRAQGAGARFRLELEQVLRVGVTMLASSGGTAGRPAQPAPAVADRMAAPVTRRVSAAPVATPRVLTAAERIPDRAGD